MSATPEVWKQVEARVQERVNSRKKRHTRFWKLRGTDAKTAVLQGTVARLMAPDAVFPYALRKRLAPRPLVAKGAPAGWLGYWRPVNSTQWEAWLMVHHQYIEHGEFWFEENEAVDALIDKAVDAERKAYCAATSDSGGPNDGKLDTEALENLSRHTEAGDAFSAEPSRDLEQWEQLGAEDAALEYRKEIEAEENAKFREAVNEYARKKKCKKQRRAIALIIFEPGLKGFEIATKSRVSESTVSKLRTEVENLAEKILTEPPEEVEELADKILTIPADAPPPAEVPHDEVLTQIAEALNTDAALDLAATFQAPDVDTDVSESALQNYARRNNSNGFGSQWGKGRRRFTDSELVTGPRYGGRYDDPAKIAERDQNATRKISATELKTLVKKSEEAGFPLTSFLRAIDSFLTKRTSDVDQLLASSIWPKESGK